jgi:peptidoglycan/LPS O-acetylase OafA/YrhL
VSYVEYFNSYRSPFHLTCESLVVGFTIAWLSLHAANAAVLQRQRTREWLFWSGTAAVMWWLAPSEILGRIDWQIVVFAPAAIGLGFGAMVLAVVSGSGTFSRWLGWRGWRPIATGSYTLYLTHMMAIPVAQVMADQLSWGGSSLAGRWLAFLPWYVGVSVFAAFALHRLVEKPVLDWRDRYLESSESFGAPGTIRTIRTTRTV